MGMDTLSRVVTLTKLFWLPFEKGSTLNGFTIKGKNLLKFLPHGSKFLPFRVDPFSERTWVYMEANKKAQKLSPLENLGRKSTSCILSLLISYTCIVILNIIDQM